MFYAYRGYTIEAATSRGTIKAKNMLFATHMPPVINLLSFRCTPYRSYAIAVTLDDNKYPEGLSYDLYALYHYYHTQEREKFLMAGGEDHKTGHEENTHAKCIATWNRTGRSWDCSCHGGRFSPEGKVLNGPTARDLEKIEPEDL